MDWLNLPDVALIQIQNNLSLRDQLNVRLVCRYWRLINESLVRRDELVLFFGIPPRPIYWLHDDKEVQPDKVFFVKYFECVNSDFFLRYFRRVRRLMIVHTSNIRTSQPLIELIQASFLQLEHFQITDIIPRPAYSHSRQLIYETNLHLPNLQTFYSQTGDMPVGLHCPKLSELFVYSELNITEKTDDQTKLCIQRLRLLLVQALTYPPDFEFSNLEVLYFNHPFSISLSNFPRLKELHYFHGVSTVIAMELRDVVVSFMEQKQALQRNEIKFYFDGRELDKDKCRLEDLRDYLAEDRAKCVMNITGDFLPSTRWNPSKFDLLSKNLRVSDHLGRMLKRFNDEIFESTFKSITGILFREPLSKKWLNLFDLSGRLQYVFYAEIAIELEQTFLDQLPDVLPNLVHFSYLPEFFSEHLVNFEFASRFKSLYYFKINHRLISMAEVRLIFEQCKFLGNVRFRRPNGVEISIFRAIGEWNHYHVNCISTDSVEFARARLSTQELLDYLEASKWVEKNTFLGQREELVPPALRLQPQQDN